MARSATLTVVQGAWVVCGLALCGCAGAAAEPMAATDEPETCTREGFTSFDAGAPVRAREELPSMTQRLGTQTVHLAQVACEPEESDAACQRRAEAAVVKRYPPPMTLSAVLVRAPDRWRTVLRVDDQLEDEVFASEERALANLEALRAAGHTVAVVVSSLVAATAAARVVDLRVTAPAESREQIALRWRFVLEPPNDELGAMFQLQRRVAEAGWFIQSITPQPDGAIAVELSCRRRPER